MPIRYEIGMEILNNFKQCYSTHISDHIHEWRHHCQLVKTYVLDQLLVEWFTKYLLAHITEDITEGGFVTEEKVIAHA